VADDTSTTAPDPVAEILRWVLQGQSSRDIRQAAAKLWPDQAAEPLIVEALRELEATADMPAPLLLAFAIESSREIYRRALEAGDMPTALRAVKTIVELGKKKNTIKPGADDGAGLAILNIG
jgi:hypothetical protein